MEKYNPTAYLLKIQKIKYNEAILPILIIFSSFAINFIRPYSFVKYLSLLGLLAFLFISLKYRVRKNIPPEEKDVILSPVYGRVIDLNITSGTCTIKKGFLTSADYRCPGHIDKLECEIESGNLQLFEANCSLPGKLVGILPLSATISCKLPAGFNLVIENGQKLIAGETVMATKGST